MLCGVRGVGVLTLSAIYNVGADINFVVYISFWTGRYIGTPETYSSMAVITKKKSNKCWFHSQTFEIDWGFYFKSFSEIIFMFILTCWFLKQQPSHTIDIWLQNQYSRQTEI